MTAHSLVPSIRRAEQLQAHADLVQAQPTPRHEGLLHGEPQPGLQGPQAALCAHRPQQEGAPGKVGLGRFARLRSGFGRCVHPRCVCMSLPHICQSVSSFSVPYYLLFQHRVSLFSVSNYLSFRHMSTCSTFFSRETERDVSVEMNAFLLTIRNFFSKRCEWP